MVRVWQKGTLAALLAVFFALSLAFVRVMYPIDDEAFFASPAFNLAQKGFFGTTVIEAAGTSYKGLSEATYWIQPLHGLVLAAWAKAFGATLWSQRTLSACFGVLDLWFWFVILRALTRRAEIALLGVALLGVNYDVLSAAAGGRMDMMSAALTHGSLAAYLSQREKSPKRALLWSCSLAALAGLTHPNGGVLSLANLALAAFYFDRGVRVRNLGYAAAPFAVAAAVWGLYIAQHPDYFAAQFWRNAGDTASGVSRLSNLSHPLAGMARFAGNVLEHHYGSYGAGGSLGTRLKLYIPAFYGVLALSALAIPGLRRQPGVRFAVWLLAAQYTVIALIEARLKVQYFYYVLTVPPVLAALCWQYFTQTGRWAKAAFAAGCGALVAVQGARIAHAIHADAYGTRFAPYARLLQQAPYRGESFWAPAEWAYAAGFDHVVEDNLCGLYSGKRPRYILSEREVFERDRAPGSEMARYREHFDRIFGGEYRLVWQDPRMLIWERR